MHVGSNREIILSHKVVYLHHPSSCSLHKYQLYHTKLFSVKVFSLMGNILGTLSTCVCKKLRIIATMAYCLCGKALPNLKMIIYLMLAESLDI